MFKTMRDGGWTACEAASAAWLSRKMPDSEVTEMKAQLKAHDVVFYNIHCAGNIIAPDPDAEHVAEAYHRCDPFCGACGCRMVLTHTGSMYPEPEHGASSELEQNGVGEVGQCPQEHLQVDCGQSRLTYALNP